jgi:tetratricopeptide (TPR) repeat protein
MATIEISEGNNDEAEALLKKVLNDTHEKSVPAIKYYIKFMENKLTRKKDLGRSMLLQDELISLYKKLYELNKDPFVLYRLGQIYISSKDDQAAISMFERAAQAYPPGNIYGENSSKIAKKLKIKIQPI